MPRVLNTDHARAALKRWRDPVAFCAEVLGLDPWNRQAEMLRAVAASRMVAVRSGHKVGKSTSAAAMALWWLVTKPRSRVVLTAPSAHQIQNICYAEVKRLYLAAEERGFALGGECNSTAYTGVRLSGGRDLLGISTDEPERMAGISAPNLLFVVDEASGIDEKIWEVILGNSAGGATIFALSNPTRTSGTYFDAFHSKRDAWTTIHIPSTDTPNFRGGEVPGLATPSWVDLMKKLWGEHSPYFDVRVRGDFPTQSENAVIGLRVVDEARARGAELATQPDPRDPLCLGVDVARYGDDETVITPRRGVRLYPATVLRSMDSLEVAGRVLKTARDMARLGEVVTTRTDVIGVGAGVHDALTREPQHIHAHAVNVSERSDAPDAYPNLRSQLWFQLRDWLRAGGALPPDDDRLAAELVAPTYAVDSKGRTVVDSKDKIKETLKRSPDRADSAALAVHAGGAPAYATGALDALRRLLPARRL